MNELISQSLAKTAQELRHYIDEQCVLPDPNAGFSLFARSSNVTGIERDKLLQMWPTDSQLKHPQSLACFGFMLGIESHYHAELQSSWESACLANLQKDLFPIDRQSFVFRPMEVLGMAIGMKHRSQTSEATRAIFARAVEDCIMKGNSDVGSRLVYWLAAKTLSPNTPLLPKLNEENRSVELASLLKWLSMQRELIGCFDPHQILEAEETILHGTSIGDFAFENAAKATILLQSLESCISRRVQSCLNESAIVPVTNRDAGQLAIQLCRNFPRFARQLLKRREDMPGTKPKEKLPRPTIKMDDEYDVQDAFHAILTLFFDDVRAEPWTPQYAANQNRIDFVLPDFDIAIELKHTRDKLTQRDVADQLIIDERYYRLHGNCKHLVCLVYDPNLKLKSPTALEKDLTRTDDDFKVTVVVCPQGR
jgi:hypothetical protein